MKRRDKIVAPKRIRGERSQLRSTREVGASSSSFSRDETSDNRATREGPRFARRRNTMHALRVIWHSNTKAVKDGSDLAIHLVTSANASVSSTWELQAFLQATTFQDWLSSFVSEENTRDSDALTLWPKRAVLVGKNREKLREKQRSNGERRDSD